MSWWSEHMAAWWDGLRRPELAGRLILAREERGGFDGFLLGCVVAFYALYGASMGLFRGVLPAAVSGLKLPFLSLLTLAVCFPALYVLNCMLGPRLTVRQCLRLLLMASSANAMALVSYAPFSYFFTCTSSRAAYPFLVLMHVVVFALAGAASVVVIVLIFRTTSAARGRRLQPAFVLTWAILYAFVGMQMSWVLRPWIGSWALAYRPFRPLEGSFLEALVGLLF